MCLRGTCSSIGLQVRALSGTHWIGHLTVLVPPLNTPIKVHSTSHRQQVSTTTTSLYLVLETVDVCVCHIGWVCVFRSSAGPV